MKGKWTLSITVLVIPLGVPVGTAMTDEAQAAAPPPVSWAAQLGTSERDWSYDIAVDGSGSSYIAGHTPGDLGGTNAGGEDAFVAKYNSAGAWQWTQQPGTPAGDYAYAIAADTSGNNCITGMTAGDLDGTNFGYYDAFVSRLSSSGSDLSSIPNGDGLFCSRHYPFECRVPGLTKFIADRYQSGERYLNYLISIWKHPLHLCLTIHCLDFLGHGYTGDAQHLRYSGTHLSSIEVACLAAADNQIVLAHLLYSLS